MRIANATRIEFYSHSGKKAVKGTSSSNNSNSNEYNDESDNDSDDETDDSTENNNSGTDNDNSVSSTGNSGIDTLINYIATNGSKSGSAKRITRTTSDYTTTIAYNESGGFLRFTLKYNADDGKYVTFDYNIDSQTNSYITVAGVGTKASLMAACKADFDMSTYTSSTELDFEKSYDEGDDSLFEYVENYNEACNALVRVAIPAFGVQLVNSANITLSDIGFTSY